MGLDTEFHEVPVVSENDAHPVKGIGGFGRLHTGKWEPDSTPKKDEKGNGSPEQLFAKRGPGVVE
jgi:hypothetical protein